MFNPTKGPDGPKLISECGPLLGASYAYRGAIIDGNPTGTLFRISLPGLQINGWKGKCRLEDALALIDAALDQRREG